VWGCGSICRGICRIPRRIIRFHYEIVQIPHMFPYIPNFHPRRTPADAAPPPSVTPRTNSPCGRCSVENPRGAPGQRSIETHRTPAVPPPRGRDIWTRAKQTDAVAGGAVRVIEVF
jgi:hypothetical protein